MDVTAEHPIEKDYAVITKPSGSAIAAYVAKDGQQITGEEKFATISGAIDYWFDKYYHGEL